MTPPALQFTEADSDRAHREWKATCGPHAIAAALGLTLDHVRQYLHEYRGWMNPTQMTRTLLALRKIHNSTARLKTADLCNGINRIQFEGPWLNPGVPAKAAYAHTHWVAHFDGQVFCTACSVSAWLPARHWRAVLIESDSPFHITHHYSWQR